MTVGLRSFRVHLNTLKTKVMRSSLKLTLVGQDRMRNTWRCTHGSGGTTMHGVNSLIIIVLLEQPMD